MPKPRRMTFQFAESSAVSEQLAALAALGYAAFAAQCAASAPPAFLALPLRVQSGWVAAAEVIRQRVLEDCGDAPPA